MTEGRSSSWRDNQRLSGVLAWTCPVLVAMSLVLVLVEFKVPLVPLATACALFAFSGKTAGARPEPLTPFVLSVPFVIAIVVVSVVRWLS